GDGCLAQRLCQAFPDASYLGIDVIDSAGRLYRGDPAFAEFRVTSVQELCAEQPEPYDLVLLVDVIHHVPESLRADVLRCSAGLVRRDGHLAVKELERARSAYYSAVYVADRYVTGDRVRSHDMPELRAMMAATRSWGFSDPRVSRVRPAHNNVLFAARR